VIAVDTRRNALLEVWKWAEFAAEKEPSTYVTFAYVHSRISRYVRRVSV
jgi:hypothetical protein